MISVWHLLWIIPLTVVIVFFAVAILYVCSYDEEFNKEESPPMDEDMNRHSGLLEDDE